MKSKSILVITMVALFVLSPSAFAGEIVAWGWDNEGQVSDTPMGNGFVAVDGGAFHNVAQRSDGSLVAWGWDEFGQVSSTPTGNDYIAVSAGGYHNVALRSDGSLVAWGWDNDGQVSDTPMGNDFIAVDGGAYHSVALKTDGSLVAWGWDEFGQVSDTPTGNDFVAVSAGYGFSVALKTDGSLVAWGLNYHGCVSDIPSGSDYVAVSAGNYHGVVLLSPLISDAGPDQTVTDTDNNGSEQVTLDGSGSYDTDGTIVSWVWTDNLGDVIPDGEITTATLSNGTHIITLTVTDDGGQTETDNVTIVVNMPPIAAAGMDIVADANEEVVLDASASTDPDGDIVQYTWTALPENIVLKSGPDSSFTTKALGRVEEVIKLTVTDNSGATSEDTVSIINKRLEDIELTPGPVGPQGQIGPQGEQGPVGITPAEISQMQAQMTALQQANAALLLQVQALEQQNALLQQAIDENRYLLEQLPQLKKM